MAITFDEIDLANRDPRTAIELDTKSGVKTIQPNTPRLLVIAQKLAAGTQPVALPFQCSREQDAIDKAGRGSMAHRMAIAAFKQFPGVDLTMVLVADDGSATVATATVTFASNATADGGYELDIGNDTVKIAIAKTDTPTIMGAALVAALAARPDLPVTAAAVAGVVTITSRNKGTVCNGIQLAGRITPGITTTATISTGDGRLAGGTGAASLTAVLTAVFPQRYHVIVNPLEDATSGGATKTHVDEAGEAEEGRGQVAVQALNVTTLASLTTLSAALSNERTLVFGIRKSPTWSVETAAEVGAALTQETIPNRPFNGVELKHTKPPAVPDQWSGTERKNLIANGVSPLYVKPGDRVAIRRAVTTRVVDDQGNASYTLLDVGIIRSLDYVREQAVLLLDNNYAEERVRWADDPDEDTQYPGDVAYPRKVKDDLIGLARQLESQGIIQNVNDNLADFLVERDGENLEFQLPADVIPGLMGRFGKITLIRRPVG